MLSIQRYFLSLAVLLAACGTYALAVAPWVAPPEVKRKTAQPEERRPVRASSDVQELLVRLFPPDAWERRNPKIVETEQGTLIIQDYRTTPEGHLELKPCTLIFYAAGQRNPQTGEVARRPIVLQAPAGALLEFDQPLDPVRAEFGRLEEGTLRGEIKISSPATQADGSDELLLTTRQLELKRDAVITNHDVKFRYGPSFGSGRDLKITLAPKEPTSLAASGSRRAGGVQSITLSRLERLSIALPAGSLLGELAPSRKSAEPEKSAPLEITCRGPFVFDLVRQEATFEDTVEVVRALPGAAPDRLKCQRLALEFQLREDKGNSRKDTAGAKSAAPLATDPSAEMASRIQRIVADGWPATLDAPSSGVAASAARIDYSMAKRRIELWPDKPGQPAPGVRRPPVTQVLLQQQDQHFVARQLAYDMAEPGRLGKLVAQGPGNLRLLAEQADAPQPVAVRWQKQLVIQPDGEYQVLSLWGQANITAEGVAQFDADELHFWLLEVPEQPAPMPAAENRPKRQRFTRIPHRMQATGSVQIRSPQLDAETARLETWFIHVPLEAEPAAPIPTGPTDPESPIRPPVAQAGFDQPSAAAPGAGAANAGSLPIQPAGPLPEPPRLQKFLVNGDLIQLRLKVQGRKFDLEDLVLREHATIDETQTELPGQEPIHLSGDLLEVHGGTSADATVELTGMPAEIGGRGLSLLGSKIHVHRGQNRMWIDGHGEATLPAPDGNALALFPQAPPAASTVVREPSLAGTPGTHPEPPKPQKLHVVWQRGMTFDGEVAALEGDVQARTSTQVALSQSLQAVLSQRIDFASFGGKLQPELGKLTLGGGVFVENRGYDAANQKVSHEQMQTPSLTIDRVSGKLHADGPGWVSTVRKNTGRLPGTSAVPGVVSPTGTGLISVHVAFERAIVGNLTRREIEFQHQVHTTYAPAVEFTDLIKAESVAELPEQGVLMTSDRLKLIEMALSADQKWIEVEASGNTLVDGKTFHVQASKVRFTSDKELLTIEGDGRADADVWYDTIPGQPRGHARARRFKYWVREEAFMGEDFSVGGFEWIGGTLKMPGLGNLPGKRKR